jgi:predicted ribosomally synthesized peptide with nif11-like leader
MSEQGARQLLERVVSDPEFRERLETAPNNEARRQIVEEAGIDVEPSDVSALRTMTGATELSDEDLEKVAGGGSATNVSVGASIGTAISVGVGAALAAAAV